MAKTRIESFQDWENYVGKELGISEYFKIDQDRINLFAEATGDFQWIHTDVEKAKTESAFKSTIAHGYLTLSLIPTLFTDILETANTKMTVNYGIENLKFGQPVLVDSEVRLKAVVSEVKNLRGICRVKLNITLEIKDQKKPAYTGTVVFLYHFN